MKVLVRGTRDIAVAICSFWMMFLISFEAEADTEWLSGIRDCTSLSKKVTQYMASLPDIDYLNSTQRKDFSEVISVACGDRYSHCSLELCRTLGRSGKLRISQSKSSVVTNPLAWLNRYLSCEELTEQIKSRYLPLGKYSTLPDTKKKELNYVLDVSCGSRFAHCKFKSCTQVKAETRDSGETGDSRVLALGEETKQGGNDKGSPVASSDNSTSASSGEKTYKYQVETAARLELAHRVEALRDARSEMIKEAVAKERKSGAQWNRLASPVEMRERDARDAEKIKRENENEYREGDSYGSPKRYDSQSSQGSRYRRRPRRQPADTGAATTPPRNAPSVRSF